MDPAQPTEAPPGSSMKLAILELRAANGLPLFHPPATLEIEAIRGYGFGYIWRCWRGWCA